MISMSAVSGVTVDDFRARGSSALRIAAKSEGNDCRPAGMGPRTALWPDQTQHVRGTILRCDGYEFVAPIASRRIFGLLESGLLSTSVKRWVANPGELAALANRG